MTHRILILYDTGSGNTEAMANRIARGVESVDACEAVLRCVPEPGHSVATVAASGAQSGMAATATAADLKHCDALILGTPVRFGNMSAAMKVFVDDTADVWMRGDLIGKPAAVFTSGGSMHGGQESTLLSIILPLLHHGMLIVGLPYSELALRETTDGGTPYGASHVSGSDGAQALSQHERALCLALGRRVARTALALGSANHNTTVTHG